jgi:hypothetical protein
VPGLIGNWTVGGVMTRNVKTNGDEEFRCSIALVSIGQTIANSLSTAASTVKSDVEEYVRSHAQLQPDILKTVIALQDGITCDPNASTNQRGGIGFQEIIKLITHLGSTNIPENQPKVVVVSGKACIKLSHPYNVQSQPLYTSSKVSGTWRRELWLNSQNVRTIPPDPQCIAWLPRHFPGTIVTTSFTLDSKYLGKEG